MRSVKDSINSKLGRFGIIETRKEQCAVCNYGVVIIVITADGEQSRCRYCENQKLVNEYDIPTTEAEKNARKTMNHANYFSNVPSDIKNAKLNDYIAETEKQQNAKQLAIDFIRKFDYEKSLVMSGDPGIGKSHIAVAIANALRKEHSVMFIKSTSLLDLIKESYNGTHYSEIDVLETCSNVDLLVLDDLGAEYAKPGDSESWASDIIYKVIDSRLGKSLIVTTNYNESALEKKYGYNGKRITSRMSDNAKKIRIVGKDRRNG